MRKCMMMLLLPALLCLPATGWAEGLPDLFTAVYEGVGEGLESGVTAALAGMNEELTLTMETESARIEEGKTLRVTVTAGNPRPQETSVSFEMKLPERLAAAPDAAWQAVLPAAQADPQSGELVPSVTTFTREIALLPGGESETAQIECEMSMGTRFYRTQTALMLCVPDVSVSAAIEGDRAGRLYPGDAYTYQIEVLNSGAAPKDVALEMTLPEGVTLMQALPAGFSMNDRTITGQVRAEAALDGADGAASRASILIPVMIDEDALEGDRDASRLLSGVLLADGERVPLPRIQVCGAKVSARMIADSEELKAGEETTLRVVVVNAGLAPADVQVSCVLPKGLRLAGEETERDEEAGTEKEATADELIATPGEDGAHPVGAAAAMTETADVQMAGADAGNGTLVFHVHMDAADETAGGITAETRMFDIRVMAEEEQENLTERLVGATLAWTVDDGEAQLGEAVAMRVVRAEFMGISAEDWNGVFWACVLLVVTIACLCAAVRRDKKEEDYCFD